MSPAKMTCEEVVYRVAGDDKLGIHETDTMVVDTATPIGVIVDECKKTPRMAFRTKVRELHKNGRIDLFEHH